MTMLQFPERRLRPSPNMPPDWRPPTFYSCTTEDGDRYGMLETRRFLHLSPAICTACKKRHEIVEVTTTCSLDDTLEVTTEETLCDERARDHWYAIRTTDETPPEDR